MDEAATVFGVVASVLVLVVMAALCVDGDGYQEVPQPNDWTSSNYGAATIGTRDQVVGAQLTGQHNPGRTVWVPPSPQPMLAPPPAFGGPPSHIHSHGHAHGPSYMTTYQPAMAGIPPQPQQYAPVAAMPPPIIAPLVACAHAAAAPPTSTLPPCRRCEGLIFAGDRFCGGCGAVVPGAVQSAQARKPSEDISNYREGLGEPTGCKKHPSGHHCFLSYRRADGSDLVGRIYAELESRGFCPFYDRECLPGGSFLDALLRNIRGSPAFVPIVTREYFNVERMNGDSDFCRKEIEEAIDLEKHVVPVVQENFSTVFQVATQLPEKVRSIFNHDVVNVSNEYFQTGTIEKLANHLAHDRN